MRGDNMKKRYVQIDDLRDGESAAKLNPLQAVYWALTILYLRLSIRCGTSYLSSLTVVAALTVCLLVYSIFILWYNHKNEDRRIAKTFTYAACAAYIFGFLFFIISFL